MKKVVDSLFFIYFINDELRVIKASEQAKMLVKFLYALLGYAVFIRFWSVYKYSSNVLPDKLWQVQWLQESDQFFYINLITILLIIVSFLVVVFTESLLGRFIVLVLFILFIGFDNSFGKINHSYHLFFPPLLIMGLCDFSIDSINQRKDFLKLFMGVQLFVLVCYTVSGVYKVFNGFEQLLNNEVSLFHYKALPTMIARRLMDTNSFNVFGDFFIRFPWFSLPLFLGAIYLELFSLFVFFKQSVHKFWGVSLALMHFSIMLTMTIGFPNSTLIVLLFFGASPFYESKTVKDTLYDLPWLGGIFLVVEGLFLKLEVNSPCKLEENNTDNHDIVFYDGDCGVCNGFVIFLYKFGLSKNLYFAKIGGFIYEEYVFSGYINKDIDSIMLLRKRGVHINSFYYSTAILYVLTRTTGWWKYSAFLILIPSFIRDIVYIMFASIRKKIVVKKSDACMLISKEESMRFI